MKCLRILLIALAAAAIQQGCMVAYWHLQPVTNGEPVVLFERYRLDMGSVSSTGGPFAAGVQMYDFECDVIFQGQIDEATDFDTIPVLVIDSLCFAGQCLARTFCAGFPTRTNASTLRGANRDSTQLVDSTGHEDVPFRRYQYTGALGVTEECADESVLVAVHSRLLDRRTFQEIARESRMVPFRLSKRRSSFFGESQGGR